MVTILPPKPPSFGQSLLLGAAQAAPQAVENYYTKLAQQQKDQARAKTARDYYGLETAGFDPETTRAMLVEKMKQGGEERKQKTQQDFLNKLLNKKRYDVSESLNNESMQAEDDLRSPYDDISDEDIITAENLGIKGLREAKDAAIKASEGQKKEKRRQYESDREYHTKISLPIVEEATNIVRSSPIAQGLIDQQRRDIASGETSGILPFLVDKLGLEMYRNPESARFRTASKERFVESLHSLGGAGARPNQFIEQQLVSAQAGLGREEEANQTVLDLEQFIKDMKEQRAKYELEEAERDQEKYGYVRSDIARRADKKMQDYAERRQEEMALTIRKRHEDNLSDNELVKEITLGNVPYDSPLTLRSARILMLKNNMDEKKAAEEARKLGFRILKEDLE